MDKFTQTRIDEKLPTGIAEHTDKFSVPTGEDPNKYFQASEFNTFNTKIDQNTQDAKDLMIANNKIVDESLKKIYDSFSFNTQDGTDVFLNVGELGRSGIVLTNVDLVSIAGLNLYVAPDSDYETPHIGKKYYITNKTGVDVVFKHNSTATLPQYNFKLIQEYDLILQNGRTIEFMFTASGMEQINLIFSNVTELNTIIVDKGFTKVDDLFTGFADSLWNINGFRYTNPTDQVITIPLCATGKVRTDRIVLDTNNNFVRVPGVEVDENPVAEAKPVNTLDYTFIPVNDAEVGTPEPIISGDAYQEKKFDLSQTFTASGSDVVIELNKLGRRVIVLNGSMTSIAGLEMDTPLVNEYPHEGKIFVFINQTDHDITLRHFDTDNTIFFIFKKGVDLSLPSGERIEFMFRSGTFDEHLRSWESELLGEIQLPAYTSARNDGANPNNKVLNVDASGNLKLYGMPIMPPPYLEELIPDSYLPSNTGNFIIKGSFFTPATTVTVEGQTLNYKTFVSDNEILVNLTTGASEGTFDVTIDNGISVVFADALLIVAGDVYKPTVDDWINTSIIDVTEEGSAKVTALGSSGSNAEWTKELDYTKDWILKFNVAESPLGVYPSGTAPVALKLKTIDNLSTMFGYFTYKNDSGYLFHWAFIDDHWAYSPVPFGANFSDSLIQNFELRYISGVMYAYVGGVLKITFPTVLTQNLKLIVTPQYYDFNNIKYIELI